MGQFLDELKEFIYYVEDLQQRYRWAKFHILKNILSFDDRDIECMKLDGVFNGDELKERILALLKEGRIGKQRASKILETPEEELEKELA